MTTVRRAIAFSFLDSYLGIALNLVSFTLLARLLTPKQIGLYSVALAIISVTQVIRDFGLVSFLIQKKDLTSAHISSAWGVSLILGGSLFVLMQGAAPFIGDFYDDPKITQITRIVTLSFLLLPFNSVCLAMLRREMQFHLLMRINLSAAFLSTVATLVMAWLGWGALSLALGAVINNVVVAIGVWLVGAATALGKPGLAKWREIMRFGGQVTFANVITSISVDINDLAVGKIMGFQAVATVSRAQGLMNLFHRDFMGAVRSVAYPSYAQAIRGGELVEEKYMASLKIVTAIAWTFYGFAALFPLEVLRLMFGPQWDMSAPLVPLFCLAGAFSATINLIPPLVLAAGHAKLVATAELIFQPVKALALSAVIFYFRDLHAFALGFVVMAFVQVPLFYAIKQRCLPTNFGALARDVCVNLLVAAVALAPALITTLLLRPAGQALPYPLFFACAGATCVAWAALLWAIKHPIYVEFMVIAASKLKR